MPDTLGTQPVVNGDTIDINMGVVQTTIGGDATSIPLNALWVDGALVGAGAPLPVADAAGIAALGTISAALAGRVGVDRSANAPAGPGTGNTLTFNGATLTLLETIAANPNRHSIEVNNTTGSLAVVVLDDGASGAGTVSLFPLAPGAGQFQQGADFVPTKELGRLRIFGTAGTFCYARET